MKRSLIVLIIVALAVIAFVVSMDRWPLMSGNSAVSPTPLADDTFVLYEPLPEQRGITSPLIVRGKARGTWFFEASFPVTLTNWDGLIIAQHYCEAQGEWMTTDFVEFECEIEFEEPADIGDFSARGSLILHKDNPSGLPEYDDAREITVFYR